jgi:hypothetical protein
MEIINEDILYQAEKLIEKQEQQDDARNATNAVFVDMLTVLAKRVNAFELVKQDVGKLKDEQTKLLSSSMSTKEPKKSNKKGKNRKKKSRSHCLESADLHVRRNFQCQSGYKRRRATTEHKL